MATEGLGPAYEEFWTRYLRAARRTSLGGEELGSVTHRNYLQQQSDIAECWIAPGFKRDGRIGHELVVDSRDADWNLSALRTWRAQRVDLELAYGRHLTWDERQGRKRCLIGDYAIGDISNDWATDTYIDWFIDCGIRLRQAIPRFGPVASH
jgi:hypothetical protein